MNRIEAYIQREGLTEEVLTKTAIILDGSGTLAKDRRVGGLLELLAEWLREECMPFALPGRTADDDRRDYYDDQETQSSAAVRALGYDQKL